MKDLSKEPALAELFALPLEDHLLELAASARPPAFSIGLCTLRYEEAAPVLRDALERAAAGEELDGSEALFFFRALHIIGGRRDPLGFKPLLRFLRRPPDEVEGLLGDATTETLAQIVAGIFDGDAEALFDAISDLQIEADVRCTLIGAAAFLTWDGRIPHPRFTAFLERFFTERLAPDEDMAWHGWSNAIALLGLRDMRSTVRAAQDAGALTSDLWEPDYFEKDLAAAERAPRDIEPFKKAGLGYVDDIVVAMERFDTGDERDFLAPALTGLPEPQAVPVTNPWRNVGRNDPCPCGSGKKAKRCCLSA